MSISAAARPVASTSVESTRRALSGRQARTVQRLVDATVEELRDSGYDGITVRGVARRAGVAPATAYNYFASRDHLVTEVFWRRLADLPDTSVEAPSPDVAARLRATLADLTLLVADEPELASACTAAMLANDPDVKLLRDRIGMEMRRRLSAALGDQANSEVLSSLEFLVSGALVHAGMGHVSYSELPDRLGRAAQVVLAGARTGTD